MEFGILIIPSRFEYFSGFLFGLCTVIHRRRRKHQKNLHKTNVNNMIDIPKSFKLASFAMGC